MDQYIGAIGLTAGTAGHKMTVAMFEYYNIQYHIKLWMRLKLKYVHSCGPGVSNDNNMTRVSMVRLLKSTSCEMCVTYPPCLN